MSFGYWKKRFSQESGSGFVRIKVAQRSSKVRIRLVDGTEVFVTCGTDAGYVSELVRLLGRR